MVLTGKRIARELTFDVRSEARSAAHGRWGQISRFLPAERQNMLGASQWWLKALKILISVPGLIFLLLIAGAFLVSMTASHTRAGKIMVGLALFLFIALGNGLGAYRILETLENVQYPILPASSL